MKDFTFFTKPNPLSITLISVVGTHHQLFAIGDPQTSQVYLNYSFHNSIFCYKANCQFNVKLIAFSSRLDYTNSKVANWFHNNVAAELKTSFLLFRKTQNSTHHLMTVNSCLVNISKKICHLLAKPILFMFKQNHFFYFFKPLLNYALP